MLVEMCCIFNVGIGMVVVVDVVFVVGVKKVLVDSGE